MGMSDLDEFMQKLLKEAEQSGPFKPCCYYNRAGHQHEVYLENVPYIGEWINRDITVYRAMDDRRIIGMVVHCPNEMRNRAEKAEALLRDILWTGGAHGGECVACQQDATVGHHDGCRAVQILGEADNATP